MSIIYVIYSKCIHESFENTVINLFFLNYIFYVVYISIISENYYFSMERNLCCVIMINCWTKTLNNMTRNCSCVYNPQSTRMFQTGKLHFTLWTASLDFAARCFRFFVIIDIFCHLPYLHYVILWHRTYNPWFIWIPWKITYLRGMTSMYKL